MYIYPTYIIKISNIYTLSDPFDKHNQFVCAFKLEGLYLHFEYIFMFEFQFKIKIYPVDKTRVIVFDFVMSNFTGKNR